MWHPCLFLTANHSIVDGISSSSVVFIDKKRKLLLKTTYSLLILFLLSPVFYVYLSVFLSLATEQLREK